MENKLKNTTAGSSVSDEQIAEIVRKQKDLDFVDAILNDAFESSKWARILHDPVYNSRRNALDEALGRFEQECSGFIADDIMAVVWDLVDAVQRLAFLYGMSAAGAIRDLTANPRLKPCEYDNTPENRIWESVE